MRGRGAGPEWGVWSWIVGPWIAATGPLRLGKGLGAWIDGVEPCRGAEPAVGAVPRLTGASPWCAGGSWTAFSALYGGVSRVGAWLCLRGGARAGAGRQGGRGLRLTVPRPGSQAHRGPHGPRGGRGRLGVAGRAPRVDRAHAAAAHTGLGERGLGHVRHGPRRPCGLGGAAQRHLWPLRARYAGRPPTPAPHTHREPVLFDSLILRMFSLLTRIPDL